MLYTIGYSPFFDRNELLNKLKELNISKLYDIRTFAYSNTFPQYNEPEFKKFLSSYEIKYEFLGNYLGGLTIKEEVRKGIQSLKDLTKNIKIKKGLNFLYKQAKKEDIAIMCAEKSPFDCHRFLAVGFLLYKYANLPVKNIINDKVFTVEETIKNWKIENNLENLNITDENLVFQRLNYIYKTLNKREEKFPKKIENLNLFDIKN